MDFVIGWKCVDWHQDEDVRRTGFICGSSSPPAGKNGNNGANWNNGEDKHCK